MLSLIGSFFISFLCSLFLTKFIIPFFFSNKIIALDLHKKNKPKVSNSGGIPVCFSLLLGLMFFIAIQTFVYKNTQQMVYLFASTLTIFLITIIGFFDDLNRKDVISGKKTIRTGLKQWEKPLLTLPAAIPLMVVSAGETMMTIPIIGPVNFGYIYPLLLIPIAVVFTSNAVNLLGGFNGSEAGMGIVYCLFLGLVALLGNQTVAAIIFFSTVGALIGFLVYNWYPAKILSGDSLTYCLGAIVVSGVIVGNMERAGLIIMMPFFIEFLLKLKSRFKASCLGKLRNDGRLDSPYGRKIYSWVHIIMNLGKLTEKQVTLVLMLIQLIFGLIIFI